MLVRCEKCGYENFPQHRFCGMCAAELRLPGPGGSQPAPQPPRVSPPPVSLRPLSQTSSPPARATREEVIAQKVSGPSFLGLGNEPADSRSLSYLLEDETPQHRGRNLILIVLLAAVAAAGWHWRQDLRVVASRLLSSPPPAGSAQDANSPPEAAASTSEPAPANGTSADNKVQQPAQAPAGQSSDQTATPSAQVPPAGTADSTQAPQASQPQADQPPANDSQATSQPQPGNSASTTAGAKTDDSGDAAAERPAPVRKAAKLQTQSGVEDLEAEGEKYLYGNGVPENCTRARTSLLAAAQRSSAQAENVLGTMYATGHCATRDLPTAYRWFSRSLRKDASNTRIEQDLKVLWNQMTPEERQLALRDQR
jgi:cytoskeletal protein RodZ